MKRPHSCGFPGVDNVGAFNIAIGKKAKEHQAWKREQEKAEAKRAAEKAKKDDELEDLERQIKKAELVKRAKEAGLTLPGVSGLVYLGNVYSANE